MTCKYFIEQKICNADCCGVVPINRETFEKHKHKAEVDYKQVGDKDLPDIYPASDDGECIFLDRNTKMCLIYDDRPDVCREYAINPELPCPWMKPNGNKRNPAQVKHIMRKINKDVNTTMKELDKKFGKQ